MAKRIEKMNYKRLLEKDLEISSGAVEGAVNYVIAKRFDSGGMRWIKERSEALLQLCYIDAAEDLLAALDAATSLEDLLAALDAATSLKDLNPLKSTRLHKLSGGRSGQWAMTVNGPWRICFRFQNGNAYEVEIIDYHRG